MRVKLALLSVVTAGVALLGASLASSMTMPKLMGVVGPGFTITLKTAKGAAVKTLKPGMYTIVVSDKSPIHNFRLKGPGLNKEITSVPFTGTKTVTVTLKKGTYTFDCDPHITSMKGTFTVK